MDSDDLKALLSDGVTISLDTNVTWSTKKLFELADLINRINTVQAQKPLRLTVCAPAHFERLLQIRHRIEKKGNTYNIGVIYQGLENKGITVVDFTKADAESAVKIVGDHITSREEWREEKRDTLLRKLGLQAHKPEVGASRQPPATIDWLIAAQAAGRGWLLVTDDQGPEFAQVPLRTTFALLKTTLEAALQE